MFWENTKTAFLLKNCFACKRTNSPKATFVEMRVKGHQENSQKNAKGAIDTGIALQGTSAKFVSIETYNLIAFAQLLSIARVTSKSTK